MDLDDVLVDELHLFENLREIDAGENPNLPFFKFGALNSLRVLSFPCNNLSDLLIQPGAGDFKDLEV